jgi:hypothetical protein
VSRQAYCRRCTVPRSGAYKTSKTIYAGSIPVARSTRPSQGRPAAMHKLACGWRSACLFNCGGSVALGPPVAAARRLDAQRASAAGHGGTTGSSEPVSSILSVTNPAPSRLFQMSDAPPKGPPANI